MFGIFIENMHLKRKAFNPQDNSSSKPYYFHELDRTSNLTVGPHNLSWGHGRQYRLAKGWVFLLNEKYKIWRLF